jgi:hypothetical protein
VWNGGSKTEKSMKIEEKKKNESVKQSIRKIKESKMTWHLAHRNLYITEIIEQSKLQLRLFFHS